MEKKLYKEHIVQCNKEVKVADEGSGRLTHLLPTESSTRGASKSDNSEVAAITEEALTGLQLKKTDPTFLASDRTRMQGCSGLRGVDGLGLGVVQVIVPGDPAVRHPRPLCSRLTRSAGPSS